MVEHREETRRRSPDYVPNIPCAGQESPGDAPDVAPDPGELVGQTRGHMSPRAGAGGEVSEKQSQKQPAWPGGSRKVAWKDLER